jgi:hypothetical protein
MLIEPSVVYTTVGSFGSRNNTMQFQVETGNIYGSSGYIRVFDAVYLLWMCSATKIPGY